MSKNLAPEIVLPLKELIREVSGFEDGTEQFNHIFKYFKSKLKRSTMCIPNKKDIDESIYSMCDKFNFHGFFSESSALKAAYKSYLSDNVPKTEVLNRVSMVKFMLCMSQSPTKYFLDHPELKLVKCNNIEEDEDEIDWGAYLNEGIERWSPDNNQEISDIDSESMDNESVELVPASSSQFAIQIKSAEKMCIMDLRTSRDELLATIQHSWYTEDSYFIKPESEQREANIGILWESHLKEQLGGLIPTKLPSVISEYKVIREILWQFWCVHPSATLHLSGSFLRPRSDVTLASVRSYAFYSFMNEFISYIELLNFFREFEDCVIKDLINDKDAISRTYQRYCNCIRKIFEPIFKELVILEDKVRLQETTYTLLDLIRDVHIILKPVKVLKQIHDKVILNLSTCYSPLICSTNLIKNLHQHLNFTTTKLEQDLTLTLFIDCVYVYINLANSWFLKDELSDFTGEFVIKKILDQNKKQIKFVEQDFESSCKEDSFLKIFTGKILKVGRNIHLLRLLGKNDLNEECSDSIYDQFLEGVLRKICEINNTEMLQDIYENLDREETQLFSISDKNRNNSTIPDYQKLENLVDIENTYLMSAFEDFFTNNKKPTQKICKTTSSLYEKINHITKGLFLKINLFENVLLEIINRRFTISGLLVKNLFIEEHLLEKQFTFFKHLFLFFDDLIFPFYKRLFVEDELSNNWRNDIWLTFRLQDIFMDIYPEFYEKCSVEVVVSSSHTVYDSININYRIEWPLNVIIHEEQIQSYQRIFQFLLKLKWALYTVNHLGFHNNTLSSEGQSKTNRKKTQKFFKTINHKNKATSNKLVRLRFNLINILNSLQHFVFGFIFGKKIVKFELDFEKAHDLNTLIESHSEFITTLSEIVGNLQEKLFKNEDNDDVFICVSYLKEMWNNLKTVTPERIKFCTKIYEKVYKEINLFVNTVNVSDY